MCETQDDKNVHLQLDQRDDAENETRAITIKTCTKTVKIFILNQSAKGYVFKE
jgi:hypothetical protein